MVRYCLCLSLDWCGVGLRDHGLPADGSRDPVVDRGRRPKARDSRTHAGRLPTLGVRIDHPAACAARDYYWNTLVVRARLGRIWCDDYLRLQYTRRDRDIAAGNLHV